MTAYLGVVGGGVVGVVVVGGGVVGVVVVGNTYMVATIDSTGRKIIDSEHLKGKR